MNSDLRGRSPRLRVGGEVQVLSREEILATLDENGCTGGMPFMPEMLQFCGKRFKVSSVAHKTCDTALKTGGRALESTYHLADLRCDGAGHGGCEARCLLFWRAEWLRDVEPGASSRLKTPARVDASCTESDLQRLAVRSDSAPGSPCYRCQATELFRATKPLRWWDPRQYITDVTTGNAQLRTVTRLIVLAAARAVVHTGIAYRYTIRFYAWLHGRMMQRPLPDGVGIIPRGMATPTGELGLREGERVRVRSHDEILATLDPTNKNRGMRFDPEMVYYCDKEFRVVRRVRRIVNEVTGEMMQMKNPCIILDGVVCRAEYSQQRLLCPRAIHPFWREIWLQRAPGNGTQTAGAQTGAGGESEANQPSSPIPALARTPAGRPEPAVTAQQVSTSESY
jgi:hypothetical protein